MRFFANYHEARPATKPVSILFAGRVMQLPPEGFNDQTNEGIRNGIDRQSLVDGDWVMHSDDRNGARQTDELPDTPHSFDGWEGFEGEERPEGCQKKTNNGPYTNSVFHGYHLHTRVILRLLGLNE
jgi:hypothetical protein